MLRIENVKKEYKLGVIGGTTIKEELQRWAARLRHKEDPTKMIGSKDYKTGETFMALDGVSFDVKHGERIGIIGHNGAGKSTLLKLISRITAPTEGAIYLNGRIASMLEVGTGFHPELTGRENVYMNGAILGMTKKEIDAKMESIIEFSEVRQFIDTPVKRYSSGMYVKLAFSVAAHLDSEIMIMDEVLAVGDMAFQQKCINKMRDVSNEQGRTILYVSHNMNTIRQLCNRVIVLSHGKVIFNGDVEEGIDVYMSAYDKMNESTTAILADGDCRSQNGHINVKMKRISVLGKDTLTFIRGERLDLEIAFDTQEEAKNVSVRVSLADKGGKNVCTSYSEGIDLAKGEDKIIRVGLDLSLVREGEYFISVGFFGLEIAKLPFNYEFINKVMRIVIVKDPDVDEKFIWNSSHNGCIQLPALSVEMNDKDQNEDV